MLGESIVTDNGWRSSCNITVNGNSLRKIKQIWAGNKASTTASTNPNMLDSIIGKIDLSYHMMLDRRGFR